MTVTLVPMTAEDLAPLLDPLARGYAEESVANRGLAPDVALEVTGQQMAKAIPPVAD